MARNETSAAYTLTGLDFDPDEITESTGIAPTETWRTGDIIPGTVKAPYRHNGWEVNSSRDPASPRDVGLEDHIADVLGRLRPGWAALARLGTRFDAEISCVVYMREAQGPMAHLDPWLVRRIGELNAAIDLDLYCLADPDEGREDDDADGWIEEV